MAVRKSKVFDADLTPIIAAGLGAFRAAKLSKAAEQRIARRLRREIEVSLKDMLDDMRRLGTFPRRSGGSFNMVRREGVRVFGSGFATLRAHLLGPPQIAKLEYGAEVTPTNATKLAIPFSYGLRTDGTPKLPGPRSWQNIKKTFILKTKKGSSFIVYKEGKTLRFLYALVDSASFPAGGFLQRAWNTKMPQVAAAMGQLMVREFGGSFDDQMSKTLHPKYMKKR